VSPPGVGQTERVTSVLLVTGLVAGGIGRHVAGLAAGLTEQGHPVTVACPAEVAERFRLGATGARHLPVEIGSRPDPVRDRQALLTLREAAAGVDVVHAHGLRAAALAVLARRGSHPPVVVTHHNGPPGGRAARVVHTVLENLVCRRADLVLGVSPDLEQRARDRGARDVAPAVVPAEPAVPTRDRDRVREELGLTAGHPLVLTVGRLTAQKGLDSLLDALSDPALAGRPLQLLVAGDGPDRERLQQRVERDSLPVTLLGHRDDVVDLLAAADVVVSSARWEGQPVWLQEALSVGAAIVATDVGGTGAVVGDGALLVPGGDPAALARAVAGVLDDTAAREDLRARARERARHLPTRADAVEAALTAYGRAGAGRPRPGDVD
jgi:glycosyltransferase involved in cell wall biosynthesis